MKNTLKLMLLVCVCFASTGAFATCGQGAYLSVKDTPGSDKYLFISDADWNKASNRSGYTVASQADIEAALAAAPESVKRNYKPTNQVSFLNMSQGAYQCGSASCTGESEPFVTLSAGHYFRGKKINKSATYKCIYERGTPRFVEAGCTVPKLNGNKDPVKKYLAVGEDYPETLFEDACKRATELTAKNALRFTLHCESIDKLVCKVKECNDGYVLDQANNTCIAKTNIVGARYMCEVQDMPTLSFKISNEYLFPTVGHESTRQALICGGVTQKACNNGTVVLLTGTHVLANKTITDPKIYRCSSDGGNVWEDYGTSALSPCASLTGRKLVTTFGDKDIYVPSSEATVLSGATYYITNNVCYALHGQEVKPEPDPNKKSCKESRSTPEGKACCDLRTSVATWDGKNCNCVGENKKFAIREGRGVCIIPESGGEEDGVIPITTFRCDAVDLASIGLYKEVCKDNSFVLQLIQEFENLCNDPNATAEQYNKISTRVEMSVEKYCQNVTVVVSENEKSRSAITAASGVLDAIVGGMKVSVWKDKDGKFNTARLASDSIAAVVLGTAGGLITSSVMKKHQVEDGFEDLKCTIGGQPVAGWGDEFTVGIQ